MTARDQATAIGLALKQAASDREISQREICAATGLKPTTVNRVLNGKFPAKSENLCAIAQAIGVEIRVLNSISIQDALGLKIKNVKSEFSGEYFEGAIEYAKMNMKKLK